jgi:hypothetical protein
MFYTGTSTFKVTIANSGNFGIGTIVPSCKLEVVAGTGTTGAITNTYFRVSTALTTSAVAIADVCAKFNSSIWIAGGSVVASSDIRIKEDIQDINDENALNMILAIEPKTYKYIDKVAKGYDRVYGFIAQQIRAVIPEATSIEKSYIPNIMQFADYNDYIITLPSQPNFIIKQNDKIKCYDKDNQVFNIEVIEVIDELTFKIKLDETDPKNIGYTENKIFIYGTEIDDLHTLDKSYIFTLNVCVTQELHRRMEAQEKRIKELETKIEQLILLSVINNN